MRTWMNREKDPKDDKNGKRSQERCASKEVQKY